MNVIIQNSLVFIALSIAIWFLLHKFGIIARKKKSISKQCGEDDCGCH